MFFFGEWKLLVCYSFSSFQCWVFCFGDTQTILLVCKYCQRPGYYRLLLALQTAKQYDMYQANQNVFRFITVKMVPELVLLD